MKVLSALPSGVGRKLPGVGLVCLLLTGLTTGPAMAQSLEINSPPDQAVLIIGESVRLSVTAPTSQVFTYAGATLEILIRPLENADDETSDAFAQSGMTVEFPDAFTSEAGVMVRDQSSDIRTVLGDAGDGEIRLDSADDPILGTVSPVPDEASTFNLTVTFSAEPQDGETDTAVPTATDVSAIVAAMQIVIPGDSAFEDSFLLQVRLIDLAGDDPDSESVILTVEPPPPGITITPPRNSSPIGIGGALVVADAAGAVTEVSPGVIECSGSRCSTPRPYLADGCSVTIRQPLPDACTSVDEDRDGRPELPALYSRVVWVVADDSNDVLASAEQLFYVAPAIGFDMSLKVIPAGNSSPVSVRLAISEVPRGDSVGSVTVTPMMGGEAVGDPVTFNDSSMSTRVVVDPPATGALTFVFRDPAQRSVSANYARLTPDDAGNAANYLYATGNGEVEIAELQGGLIRFESATALPETLMTRSFVINNFRVTSGTVVFMITNDNVEVGVLNNPAAVSSVTVDVTGDDLTTVTVTFEQGVLNNGDIVELALMLASGEEPASTLRKSLLFPFDSGPLESSSALQVYDEQGVQSQPIRSAGDAELVFGAWAVNAARRDSQQGSPVYSAAFSPDDIAADTLPSPRRYNGTGIFDFTVRELDNPGDVATVLIPLLGPVSSSARLLKYASDGEAFAWNSFTTNDEPAMPGFFDKLWSAPKAGDVCPAIGASRGDGETYAWRLSADGDLNSGDECLLLQIQDGGPNDADGLVNGVIYDPNAVAGGGRRKSGAVGPWLLLMLSLGLVPWRRLRNGTLNRLQTTATPPQEKP